MPRIIKSNNDLHLIYDGEEDVPHDTLGNLKKEKQALEQIKLDINRQKYTEYTSVELEKFLNESYKYDLEATVAMIKQQEKYNNK